MDKMWRNNTTNVTSFMLHHISDFGLFDFLQLSSKRQDFMKKVFAEHIGVYLPSSKFICYFSQSNKSWVRYYHKFTKCLLFTST